MKFVKIVLSYDGSGFKGWARQPGLRTVEQNFKSALLKVIPDIEEYFVGGRTDTGVHAMNQVVSVKCRPSPNLAESGLVKGLNSILPDDIFVKSAVFLDTPFNARFNAVSRTYEYHLKRSLKFSVFERNFITYFKQEIDLDLIREVSIDLIGHHNFKGFSSSSSDSGTFERDIMDLIISGEPDDFKLEITGNAFLTHMVRIITGTLLEIGSGKKDPDLIKEILNSGRRDLSGAKAAPGGLFLKGIKYEF